MQVGGVHNKKTYPEIVWFNDEWVKYDEAKISVFDRGFMLGDGVYEVTPFYEGKAFGLKEHLARLQYSLDEIMLDLDASLLKPLMFEAVSKAGLSEKDAAVYIQVSRGVAPRTHYFPDNVKPTILMYAFPATLRGFENKQWSVLVSEDLRWQRCDIKSTSLLANIKSNTESHLLGLDENLLVRDGLFTEGSHSTIFFVRNNTIYTHPEGPQILSGITRKFVIEICSELNIEVKEEAFPLSELERVDEAFLTGTTTQVMAIKEMFSEGNKIYDKPEFGPLTRKIQQAFIQKTRSL
ncbi:aminotransferase class IV [Gramella sp. KN1008]|uniref:aminotransferase class IV n=1 Tax=Gramella sp. KN1008 TaxID=2529298 RepID=UPI00103B5796|nr:aminotransferase class IV [Gramella sp. KN1008]TBW28491.1 aminotransferase IV [Gramella sp. KN1008]